MAAALTADANSAFVNALISVSFISFAPVVILLVIPANNKVVLKYLLALAAGCLLGDAFLHLIPESSHQHDHAHHHDNHHADHSHDHQHHHHHDGHNHDHHHHDHNELIDSHGHNHDNSVGLRVLCGIIAFFVLEKYIYSLKFDSPKMASKAAKKKNDDYVESHDHDHFHAAGILNLISDFLHNFTDGLAIGASFLASGKLGISTTVAIFLHEIPHEISDFAILLQSGYSKKKAILLQCLTAVGAISGTLISLFLGSHDDRANAWILPFTAGGFIYIAMVHLIPQLKNSSFVQTIAELLCFASGVGFMYMVGLFE